MTDFELENHPSNRFHQLRQEKLRSRLSKELETRLATQKLSSSAVDNAMQAGGLLLLRSLNKSNKLLVDQNKALLSFNKRQTEATEGILEYIKERDKPKTRPMNVRG